MRKNVPKIRMQNAQTTVRAADAGDIERLTAIWCNGWHDAHDGIVPTSLVRLRTHETFRERLSSELQAVRVVSAPGATLGFAMIRGPELYQFFVVPSARGTGVAATLISHVEREMAHAGVRIAWLACAVGNTRAARFYEKREWRRVATATVASDTTEGPIPVQMWRYEKALA